MLVQILIILLFILIALLFYLIFKPVDIHAVFKNNNSDINGYIHINYILFEFIFDIPNRLLKINLKIYSHKFTILTLTIINDESSKETDELNFKESIKEIISNIIDAKEDLLKIVKLLTETCKFKKSHINMNLGLNNNNSTIKLCSMIWAITAPFYPLGLDVLLVPEINKFIIKTDMDVSFNIFLYKLIQIIIKIITTENLRKLIKSIIG
ncbi:hypothetical protein [Methanosphaera sp.]